MFSALFKDLSWVKRTVRSHKTSLQLDNICQRNPENHAVKREKKINLKQSKSHFREMYSSSIIY